MALIKCPECGKEISDKASACPNCGCPIGKESKNLNGGKEVYTGFQELNTNKVNQQNKKSNKGFEILCRVLLLLASIIEIINTSAWFEDATILMGIAGSVSILSYVTLCFALNNKKKLAGKAVLLQIIAKFLYLLGWISKTREITYILSVVIIYIFAMVVWYVIYENIQGKQLQIFQNFKIMYIILPLLEPILFSLIMKDIFIFLLFGIGAFATITVGCFYGWNLTYEVSDKTENRLSTKKKSGIAVSSIVFIIIVILSIRCRHEWKSATCTSPKICKLCGETKGNPLGHKKGEWSEWDIDYDKSVNVREMCCARCEEILETETEEVTTFVDNKYLTIYPDAFAGRFDSASGSINGYTFKSEVVLDDTKQFFDDENFLFYEINDESRPIGMYSFIKEDDKTVPYCEQYKEKCAVGINILIEETDDVGAVVYATMLAINPSLNSSDEEELYNGIIGNVGSQDGFTMNSLKYVLYKDGRYHYLLVRAV